MVKNQRQGTVYVYNRTREAFVATEAIVADSYVRRLVGLLGKTKRWAKVGTGMWIVPSRGVHTIGMMFPIDLLFLSKDQGSCPRGGVRAAISHLQGFLESVQRPGAAAAHDLSDRDEGRRSTGDFLARPANRGPGAGYFLRRLAFLECRIVVDAVYEIYRNTSCRIYVRHARCHVHFSPRALWIHLVADVQVTRAGTFP